MKTQSPQAVGNPANSTTPSLALNGSRLLTSWLQEQKLSLVFTTYDIGKVFLIGLEPDGKLSVFERTFSRCMGLSTSRNTIYMSSLYQLWRFENTLPLGQQYNGYDKLYVPQVGYTTGDIDIHDIGVDQGSGKVVFVSTLFSCLATTSETKSFEVVWKPPFISKIAAEDRCHLNGLAFRDGRPRYVTMVSKTDVNDGWREHRHDGGLVMDIETNEIIASNLSMPHSPRWHQGKLWLLNSGKGEFGYLDVGKNNAFTPVAFCAGYARGLHFQGHYAVIGLSKSRHNKTFSDLALQQRLDEKQISGRCGIQVVDITTGDVVHTLSVEGMVNEIYDVGILSNVRCPMALGFRNEQEIRRIISFDDSAANAPLSRATLTPMAMSRSSVNGGAEKRENHTELSQDNTEPGVAGVSVPSSSSSSSAGLSRRLQEKQPKSKAQTTTTWQKKSIEIRHEDMTPQYDQRQATSITAICSAAALFGAVGVAAIMVGWLASMDDGVIDNNEASADVIGQACNL